MNKLVILFLVFAVLGSIEAYQKVALEKIPYLDLNEGKYTIGNKPIVELLCVDEGYGTCDYRPTHVHCVNTGKNVRGQVIWKCKANLDERNKFGSLRVS